MTFVWLLGRSLMMYEALKVCGPGPEKSGELIRFRPARPQTLGAFCICGTGTVEDNGGEVAANRGQQIPAGCKSINRPGGRLNARAGGLGKSPTRAQPLRRDGTSSTLFMG